MKELSKLPPVLTPFEYSQVTGLNVATVRRWCRNGRLPAKQAGKVWLISRDKALGELM